MDVTSAVNLWRAKTTRGYASVYPPVAPNVEDMADQRLAYDDADTAHQMHQDCAACASELMFPVLQPVPSILFADYPREVTKREVTVSDAAVLLASKLHLG
ncbi:MAG: hypothetical protein JWR35_2246 [Marmoricola sp.]|nr:hypothetical protein [Marmoricola sp.]